MVLGAYTGMLVIQIWNLFEEKKLLKVALKFGAYYLKSLIFASDFALIEALRANKKAIVL